MGKHRDLSGRVPQHRLRVDDDASSHAAVVGEGRRGDVLWFAGVGFVQADEGREAAAVGRNAQPRPVPAHVLYEVEEKGLAGEHISQVGAFVPATDDGSEGRIIVSADGGHVEDGAFPELAEVSVGLGELGSTYSWYRFAVLPLESRHNRGKTHLYGWGVRYNQVRGRRAAWASRSSWVGLTGSTKSVTISEAATRSRHSSLSGEISSSSTMVSSAVALYAVATGNPNRIVASTDDSLTL